MNTYYVIPNFECNLNCPHCDIHLNQHKYDHDKFMSAVSSIETGSQAILFGGEPTLYLDRLTEILQSHKMTSISTNLLSNFTDVIRILKDYPECEISTSWNMSRFDANQEKQWIQNVFDLYRKLNKKAIVLITLTDDVLTDNGFEKTSSVLKSLDQNEAISGILFEHLVSENYDLSYPEKCDRWLCRMHSSWKYRFENMIDGKVLCWKNDCSHYKTILPDGTMAIGCPHHVKFKSSFIEKCITCEHSGHCQPCILQQQCVFPKSLYSLISQETQHET